MSTISSNLQAVRQQIIASAQLAGRQSSEINLLAVSKTFTADAVLEAALAGQHAFGENYLQEAIDKIAKMQLLAPEIPLEWHFIGPIQSNKTRLIAEHFSWVHAVDRLKIAERLSAQRPAHLPPLNICLQVNISAEASKSGVPPGEAAGLALQIARLPNLRLRGLMAIPEPADDLALQRAPYAQLRLLLQQINVQLGVQADKQTGAQTGAQSGSESGSQSTMLDILSMGMSADSNAAILEGSTLVRVGSAIFGKRDYANHVSSAS